MKLYDSLPEGSKWALAARALPPKQLARLIAGRVGEWEGREGFDRLVRTLYHQLLVHNPADAETFRQALDRRLYGKYQERVDWTGGGR